MYISHHISRELAEERGIELRHQAAAPTKASRKPFRPRELGRLRPLRLWPRATIAHVEQDRQTS